MTPDLCPGHPCHPAPDCGCVVHHPGCGTPRVYCAAHSVPYVHGPGALDRDRLGDDPGRPIEYLYGMDAPRWR